MFSYETKVMLKYFENIQSEGVIIGKRVRGKDINCRANP